MTRTLARLAVDLGPVDSPGGREPFAVELRSTALADLVAHAGIAHRVYELMLIQRPGDVLGYLEVVCSQLPPAVARRLREGDGPLLFPAFDRLFRRAGDDTDPADEAWLTFREGPVLRAFADQVLALARQAQARLPYRHRLARHEATCIRAGTHPFAYLDREAAVERARRHPPQPPRYGEAFYAKLGEILREPAVVSIAVQGDGDTALLRLLCEEQRRRADRTGHAPAHALAIDARVTHRIDAQAWDADVHFRDDGIGHGDLHVDENAGECLRAWVEGGRIAPGLGLFTPASALTIPGYGRIDGEGWAFHRHPAPMSRRHNLAAWNERCGGGLPALAFTGADGDVVFAHEKALVMVGRALGEAARDALARAVAAWEARGGDPLLVVEGDLGPFVARGCRGVVQPEGENLAFDLPGGGFWLQALLADRRPWIDVAVLLHPPVGWQRVMDGVLRRQRDPWPPWVVATGEATYVTADRELGTVALRGGG